MGPPFFQDTMLPLLALSFEATSEHMMSWQVAAYNSHHGSSCKYSREALHYWLLMQFEHLGKGTDTLVVAGVPCWLGSTTPLKSELRYCCFTQPVLSQFGSQPNCQTMVIYSHTLRTWLTTSEIPWFLLSFLECPYYIHIIFCQDIIFQAHPTVEANPHMLSPGESPRPGGTLWPRRFGLQMLDFCMFDVPGWNQNSNNSPNSETWQLIIFRRKNHVTKYKYIYIYTEIYNIS